MDKYATLFMRLNKTKDSRIYVADDFDLDVAGHGDVACGHGIFLDIYHVPNLSANLLFVAQLIHTCNIVEFWLDQFYVCVTKK